MHKDKDFIPESLQECQLYYVPPVERFITCKDFGNVDGMDGSCHWCEEMTPYQWEMCSDEAWIKSLMKGNGRYDPMTREEAIEFIENYKQNSY